MVFTLSWGKQGQKVLYYSKKRICPDVISNTNRNKSNKLNISNSENVIGTSNLPHINVQNDSPFNTLINLQKVLDIESSLNINDKIMY